jgi:uncharacterized membrane protein YjjP (DUF1212 family)
MNENETKSEVGNVPPFCDSVRFITALVKAYQRYGGYSFETDQILIRVAKALGLNAEINATPNSTEIALWFRDENQQTIYLAMTRDTDYNLTELAQVKDLIDQVIGGQVLPVQGLERLREIERAPLVYGNLINALAFVLCGAGFAAIIGASWLNVLF